MEAVSSSKSVHAKKVDLNMDRSSVEVPSTYCCEEMIIPPYSPLSLVIAYV
jgi:hypothetical protein